MTIERFSPSAALQAFVKEIIIIESDLQIVNTIIPDTSMVMAFRFRGQTQTVDGVTHANMPSEVISGLRRSARVVSYSNMTSNLLVVLKENGFVSFSKIPANELFSQSISLDHVFNASELVEISDRLSNASFHRDRIDAIETFMLGKLIHSKKDHLVENAIHQIKKENGIIRIKDLASYLNISQDPFEKRFRTVVGSSPKQFASIVRLKTLLKKYPNVPSLTEASYQAGYFDQSHFIKDFRLFTGKAPKDFFSNARFW